MMSQSDSLVIGYGDDDDDERGAYRLSVLYDDV
jgi:hypothetical protein